MLRVSPWSAPFAGFLFFPGCFPCSPTSFLGSPSHPSQVNRVHLSHFLGTFSRGTHTKTEASGSSATGRPYLRPNLNKPSVKRQESSGEIGSPTGCQMMLRNCC